MELDTTFNQNGKPDDLPQWHMSFFAGLQLELINYKDYLEYINENFDKNHVIVIKKLKPVVIEKNIAEIFKTYNIIEYKSPLDTLVKYDFYLVYGYIMQYIAAIEAEIRDVTMTLVCEKYPRKLITHLKTDRKFEVTESNGVYHVIGDHFPIQIIVRKFLSEDENEFLSVLTNNANPKSVSSVMKKSFSTIDSKLLFMFLDAILKSSPRASKEVFEMGRTISRDHLEELQAAADKYIIHFGLDKIWYEKYAAVIEKERAEKEKLKRQLADLQRRLDETLQNSKER